MGSLTFENCVADVGIRVPALRAYGCSESYQLKKTPRCELDVEDGFWLFLERNLPLDISTSNVMAGVLVRPQIVRQGNMATERCTL